MEAVTNPRSVIAAERHAADDESRVSFAGARAD
jgi:hypothetical protein